MSEGTAEGYDVSAREFKQNLAHPRVFPTSDHSRHEISAAPARVVGTAAPWLGRRESA